MKWSRAASISVAILVLASTATAASAHTSALCVMREHITRCLGVVANRTITLGASEATLTIKNGHGRLWMTVEPMISLLTPPTSFAAKLSCNIQHGKLACVGTARVGDDRVRIAATGTPEPENLVIWLSDASRRRNHRVAGATTPTL